MQKNNLALSTFYKWRKKYSESQEIKFIPVKVAFNSKEEEQSKTQASKSSEGILLELGACKIYIEEQTSLSLLTEVIKVVTSLCV